MKKNDKKSVRQRSWYQTLHIIFVVFPLLALVCETIYVGIISVIEPSRLMDAIQDVAIPAIVELLLAFSGKFVDDYLESTTRESELENIKESVYQIVPNVSNLSTEIQNFNNASIEVLYQHEDFYTKLTKCRQCATKEVLLTQLDPNPPESYEDESRRKSYFASDISYAKSHPNVSIYRILSVETPEKLKWVKELIDATKDLPNLFLAYVDIHNIAKESPFPKMLSLQIIDEKEVFVLNPQYSYMPRSYKPCYYMKNDEVARIYADYYKAIWRELSNENSPHGFILKDGKDIRNLEQKINLIKQSHTRKN